MKRLQQCFYSSVFTKKKPDQYCTGQARIVKPKINQSSLSFDSARACRNTFLCSRGFHFTFDGERMGVFCFVGSECNRFSERAYTLGVVTHFNDVAFAGHDRLFRIGRYGAAARTFCCFNDERLVAGVGEFEFADRVTAFSIVP